MDRVSHQTLPCGIELGTVELPQRHAVRLELRVLSGMAHEPSDLLGLARLIQDTIDLGTKRHDGRGLSDAFDEIGASHGGTVGREATSFNCTVLPEFLDRAVELLAEYLTTPTFPDDTVKVAVDLTRQELDALDDDPGALADKLIGAQAYGPLLGRHALGEPECLDRITRQHLIDHWSKTYGAARMQVSAAGAFETQKLVDLLQHRFDGFGKDVADGRSRFDVVFDPKRVHHHKELEQQQIAIAFPGVAVDHPDYPVQRVTLSVLSGGMSSRLFTEVREKKGLVYWVSAWGEHPRGSGMIFLGASTTPERCDVTYETLLSEVDRLSQDLTEQELNRAAIGIVAKIETRGDITSSRCGEMADDLFHYGRPVAPEEKAAQIQAVTVEDVHRYLADHPRDALSVVTLGPKAPEGSQLVDGQPSAGATA